MIRRRWPAAAISRMARPITRSPPASCSGTSPSPAGESEAFSLRVRSGAGRDGDRRAPCEIHRRRHRKGPTGLPCLCDGEWPRLPGDPVARRGHSIMFVNHWLPRQVFYHGDTNRLTTDPQTRNYLQDCARHVVHPAGDDARCHPARREPAARQRQDAGRHPVEARCRVEIHKPGAAHRPRRLAGHHHQGLS